MPAACWRAFESLCGVLVPTRLSLFGFRSRCLRTLLRWMALPGTWRSAAVEWVAAVKICLPNLPAICALTNACAKVHLFPAGFFVESSLRSNRSSNCAGDCLCSLCFACCPWMRSSSANRSRVVFRSRESRESTLEEPSLICLVHGYLTGGASSPCRAAVHGLCYVAKPPHGRRKQCMWTCFAIRGVLA